MTSTTFKNKNGTHLKMMNNTQRTMALQKTTKLVKAMGHEEQQEIHKIEAIMQKMERDSKFLKESPSPDLPEFDVNDISIGDFLGNGEFGDVFEINSFRRDYGPCDCARCLKTNDRNNNVGAGGKSSLLIAGGGGNKGMKRKESFVDFAQFAEMTDTDNITKVVPTRSALIEDLGFESDHSSTEIDKAYMKNHTIRAGVPRFAMKRLNASAKEGGVWSLVASLDLAKEARFLGSLSHPNIIKLRGTMSDPGHHDFSLILDRMVTTLDKAIIQWKAESRKRRYTLNVPKILGGMKALELKRLLVLFDISRAMKYLHSKKIVYRDLKPDNIGFDVRGTVKIFDFGLCKELQNADDFEMTGLTGSRRYMAPEVVLCQDYGLSADVYSFGILFWEVAALAQPFKTYSSDRHFQQVVVKGKRPATCPAAWLTPNMRMVMFECWRNEATKRPTFSQIGARIKGEISSREGGQKVHGRTVHLLDKSWSSRHGTRPPVRME